MRSLVSTVLALPLLAAGGPVAAGSVQTDFGVYEYVMQRASGTVDDAGRAVESALAAGGWRVLGKVDAGAPEGCRFKARVLAAVEPE
mgnify:FL=1